MPELPEVEVTRRGLVPLLRKRTITAIWWSGNSLRIPVNLSLLNNECLKQSVEAIHRRAKNILIRLSNGAVLRIHLGMTGKLAVLDSQIPRAKHDHLIFSLDNNQEFRFNDVRRFGLVEVWASQSARQKERSFSQSEGLEPLSNDFQPLRLMELAARRTVPVKAFLMNSKLVAGIGNIYANEALFLAKLSPFTPAKEVTVEQWKTLCTACVTVLKKAIKAGGSSISDFLATNGQPGYFQLQLKVYGQKGLPCPVCRTPIEKSTLAGRATFCCPSCQPSPLLSVAQKKHTKKRNNS
ncbi:bifunctional DNA-formamidopyrimidine glycosylase/DNA-(apurinic or apyrimidinic site) lyase [Desulfogranum japonicum]|uniref:bifunctional DNA-formamidopyrimidine glycosylase/DNA-(apurinic or apyrimidinic site) lyase n=1 Tax=Desulfogranum japonicum TaxID=231447 RepID=UPI00041A35DD|nr:bifunctional DNA-formamidopyrimidine glycosylase/DNA-(apurinic or apyrimidinic site) lyase [Desulfogranum japonicum]